MKNLIISILVVLTVSCATEIVDKSEYVSLKGKLKSENVETILIQGKGFSKEIKVDSDGSFSDTLKVNPGIHAISNGNDRITLFLKNGYDLNLNFKGIRLEHGVNFDGFGSSTNNFIEEKRVFYLSEYANPRTYFELETELFEKRLSETTLRLQKLKEDAVDLDSVVAQMDSRNDDRFFGFIKDNYTAMNESLNRLAKGKPSPMFQNYENIKGTKSSLADYNGSYVYMDIWATWCAPCKAEIPFLKEIEATYKDKNITFISISVDVEEAHETWSEMVKSENLGGVQLYADQNFQSEFIKAYTINAIPRFILVDPNGNIVDSDAPRPSDPKLKEVLNSLLSD